MNKIAVTLKEVRQSGEVALLSLESIANSEHIFTMLMINIDSRLKENIACSVIFKESEVMLCDKSYTLISARNRFVSVIENIETDEIFARVSLRFEDKIITSLITKIALDSMNLQKGEQVAWFVKSNEIMLDWD